MADNKGYIVNNIEKGSINISEDVLAVIAAVAASDVEGVHEQAVTQSKEIGNILGRKGNPKGVKLTVEGDNITVDIDIIVQFGYSVSEVGALVQKSVVTAIEGAAGIPVAAVNVNISGIALQKKEK
ncbi:MAG: Asp23/Gls24 family envelope stress response protein [Oscillospiraceae bacterium]|nr:Asp23/Gls24 family envelope stress response protein [Oscillospiraceae bacterium]